MTSHQPLLDACLSTRVAYDRLCTLCDRFGHRLSGSASLEAAIDWAATTAEQDDGLTVERQPVQVPHWVRGRERLDVHVPREMESLAILGIGNSTGGAVQDARVHVVRDFAELDALDDDDVRQSVICFNAPFTTYGETVQYRVHGASRAAARGAAAVLVRSVCPVSLYTPHTGTLVYDDAVCSTRIPAACITVEDAELFQRWQDAGETVRVSLHMEAKMLPDATSHNVIMELPGSELPEEIVVLGGHIDSWDVGQGAHDDAQGCIVAWEALRLIKSLGLKPRRTIRAVFWTNEENGQRGGKAYCDRERERNTLDKHVAAIETDLGVHQAIGFGFSGNEAARGRLEGLLKETLSDIDCTRVVGEGRGVDIGPLIDNGVPGMLLRLHDDWWNSEYFHIHHTAADTVDKIDPKYLNQNLAACAGLAYALATVDVDLRAE